MRTRKRNRLRGFDYASDRFYFITTCVHKRICAFGEVVANQMILNECGMIADRQWRWLENQNPYVRMHTHMVMPNHVHAIIEINRELIHTRKPDVGSGRDLTLHQDSLREIRAPSLHHDSPHYISNPTYAGQNFKIKSLSELIGAYKTTTSKHIHLITTPDGSRPYAYFAAPISSHSWPLSGRLFYQELKSRNLRILWI